jgi:hypothetical protein
LPQTVEALVFGAALSIGLRNLRAESHPPTATL